MYRNVGIGSWIARRARMTPGRAALWFGGRTLTYGELDARVTRLAHGLARCGVGEGDRVAFLGDNHPAALETLFASGLLGAVAVPLHPGFDDEALARVLDSCRPAAVIATPRSWPALRRAARRVAIPTCACTDPAPGAELYERLIEDSSTEPIDRPIDLERTCLLAFTSGTTGPNKGIRLSHGNLLWNAINTLTGLDYVSDDTMLTSAPLYRMGGLGFSLPLLLKGGRCVLQDRASAELSLELIERHRISVWFDSVSALEAVAAADAFAEADLSSLRICLTGGTAVPSSLVEAYARKGVCLQSGYGLTEASPLALLADRSEVEKRPGVAGRPPLFCAVRVVDSALDDVADGEPGELLVAGPNVMQGSWPPDEEVERARVVDGWLRTGDAARIERDGVVTVVGRVADALSIAGSCVHPGPLELRLGQLPGVRECAIVQIGPAALGVFLGADRKAPFGLAEVARICRSSLGEGASIVVRVVDRLPRNPNGKILRAQLVRAAQDHPLTTEARPG